MFKNLKKQAEGFTIIEVMIVLVIAAVILLIVFLAVPALQRNSRNTQRKNDVAGLLGAVNEWSGNNGGGYPTAVNDFTNAIKNAKLGFYDPSAVTEIVNSRSAGNAITVTQPSNTSVVLVIGATCSGNNAVAANRSIVAIYTVEAGSGDQQVCLSS